MGGVCVSSNLEQHSSGSTQATTVLVDHSRHELSAQREFKFSVIESVGPTEYIKTYIPGISNYIFISLFVLQYCVHLSVGRHVYF